MSTGASRVPLAEVADLISPGQPLPFRVLDSLGRLLLGAGHVVDDARQLAALLERGACVEYEEVAAVRRQRARAAAPAAAASVRKKSWFERFDAQVLALDALLRELGRDAALAPRIERFADEHITLTERHLDAALFVAVRQNDERRTSLYSVSHALHTATVLLLTGRQLAWTPQRTACGIRAALTMNCAMTELQSRLAEQRDPPTRKQIEQVRAHPHAAAKLLRDCGVTDPDWLAAVENHHERNGGSGYPAGLLQVDELAHALRAADVYVAKLTARALRPALTPQVAARQLFQEEQGARVAGALIKSVGIYPPGDFVQLANGDTAVVVRRAAPGSAIQVASLLAASGKPLNGAPKRDTALADFTITGALANRQGLPRVLPEVVFGVLE